MHLVLLPHRPHARRRAPVGAAGPPIHARASCAAPAQGTARGLSGATTIASGGGLTDRYAAALYAHADEQHALDTVVAEMEALGRLIDASADFRRLLESPLIDVNQATRAALAVLEQEGFGKPVRDFVGVIAANRRLRSLRRDRRAPSPPWSPSGAASSPPTSPPPIRSPTCSASSCAPA